MVGCERVSVVVLNNHDFNEKIFVCPPPDFHGSGREKKVKTTT